MKTTYIIVFLLTFFACKSEVQQPKEKPIEIKEETVEQKLETPNCEQKKVALDFLNEYIELIRQPNSLEDVTQWLKKEENISSIFISKYEEYIQNTEFIDFDPILKSQDFPSEFIFDSLDGEYVKLTAKDWDDYYWIVRVKDCEIIGSGVINMNEEKTDKPKNDVLLTFKEKITKIRQVYKTINENQSTYKVTKVENDESTEGGTSTVYIHDNLFPKIVEEFMGETGKRSLEYYFENGDLRFVFEQITEYNSPIYVTESSEGIEAFDPEKSIVKEHRYYFYDEEMIQWLDEKKENIFPESEKFKQKQEELLEVYQRYQ